MRLVLPLAIALPACAELHPLSEVPIEGGTAEQRVVVRDELLAFDAWVGEGRVGLRSIHFEGPEAMDDYGGRYFWHRKRVLLSETLQHQLGRVVRHELCHALDYQEHMLSGPNPTFDGRINQWVDTGFIPDHGSVRERRGEVLARVCEVGPALASVIRTPCPTDPDYLAPLVQYLVDHVWTGELSMAPSDGPIEPVASYDLGSVPDQLIVAATTDASSAVIGVPGGGLAIDQVWVDLETGDPIPDPGVPVDGSGAYEGELPDLLPLGLARLDAADAFDRHVVVQGDRALAVVEPTAHHLEEALGQLARRAVAYDGDQWRAVEACPGEVATGFTTPGQLWLAWAEGARIQWAPVGASSAPGRPTR